MTEDFMKEEKAITDQFDHDPLLKLKEREVDLKAMDAERKQKEDEARINLDKTKISTRSATRRSKTTTERRFS